MRAVYSCHKGKGSYCLWEITAPFLLYYNGGCLSSFPNVTNPVMSANILGSKARGNTNYDPIFKLATATSDDSVIFVIITPQA